MINEAKLSKKLEHPGKYFVVKKSIKVCEGVRKINFLKVRTLLRGTVKSVTNVWKIKIKKLLKHFFISQNTS